MSEDGIWGVVLAGLAIIIFLLVLMLPVEGQIFGETIRLPIIGWIALAGFAVIAVVAWAKGK